MTEIEHKCRDKCSLCCEDQYPRFVRSLYEVYIIAKKSQSFACCGKLNKVEDVPKVM